MVIILKAITITKRDVIWSYVATAVNSGIGFLLLPLLALYLNDELLALWYIFSSLGAIVNLLDFGLTPSLSRNMTNAWCGARVILRQGTTRDVGDEPNYRLMGKIMGASRLLFLGIALFASVALLTVGSAYIAVVSSAVDPASVLPAWAVYCGAIFLNVYYGYYATFLRGIGQIGSYSRISIASKLIQAGLSFVLLLTGIGLLAPSIAYLVSGLSLRVLSKRSFGRAVNASMHPELGERPSRVDVKETLAIMWPNSWRDGLVSLADYLTTQGGTIVCSLFLSLRDAGIYAISLQLLNVVHNVSAVYCNSKRPAVQSAYINRDKRLLTEGVTAAMFLYAFMFMGGTVLVAFVFAPILTWIKPSYVFDTPFLFFLALYLYLIGRYKLYASYISMTNDLSYYLSFIVSGVLALGAALISLMCFGSSVYALIAPQLAVQLSYNIWKWPKYFLGMIDVNERDLFSVFISKLKALSWRCRRE